MDEIFVLKSNHYFDCTPQTLLKVQWMCENIKCCMHINMINSINLEIMFNKKKKWQTGIIKSPK